MGHAHLPNVSNIKIQDVVQDSPTYHSVNVSNTDPGPGPGHSPLGVVLGFFESSVRESYFLYVVNLDRGVRTNHANHQSLIRCVIRIHSIKSNRPIPD